MRGVLARQVHYLNQELFMKISKLLGIVALSALVAGVIKNLPEIRRYVRMYTI